jgi:hypothetical protein
MKPVQSVSSWVDAREGETVMKKLVAIAALGALAVPGAAVAAPTAADQSEGKRECRTALRTVETRANFVELVKLEAKANSRNAFGKCVTVRTAAATEERREARSSAVTECRALFPKPAPGAGKPAPNQDRNAFGKCVSEKAKAKNDKADAEQRRESLNPAKACRAEQKADPSKFTAKNAFGKCVSKKAQAQNEDKPEEQAPAAS